MFKPPTLKADYPFLIRPLRIFLSLKGVMRTEAMQHTVIILLWDIRQGGYNEVQSTVTFPISFSNAALGVMATLSQGDQEAAQTWSYTARDLYLFQRYSGRWAHWIAVGF